MFSALLYLQLLSLKNRLTVRLRRLKQPRYLFGAVIGGFYLASVFSRSFMGFGRAMPTTSMPAMPEIWELLAGTILFVLLLATWILPYQRAALVFTEAEIAFLFPAPVRRSTLIHYKLLKSQLGILVTVFFLTILSPRAGGFASAAMRATGWWILLSTMQLHALGTSFTRTILLERGFSQWKRQLAVILAAATLIGAAYLWASREVPALQPADTVTFSAMQKYLHRLADSSPAVWLLGPFRALARPFLAPDWQRFLAALGPALAILMVHYFWVVRSDVAFEEASVEASKRQASIVAEAAKTGQRSLRPRVWRKRRAPFPLSPRGSPAIAILWKNLLAAGQLFSMRVFLGVLVWCLIVGVMLGRHTGSTGWPDMVSYFAEMLLGWSLLAGAQFVRFDFRHDLAVADLLKSYPVKGWQMALGEILAPAAILTGVQWLLLALIGAMRVAARQSNPETSALEALSLPAAGVFIAPFLNALSLLIPNAAALLLPGWFTSSGNAGSGRGIEVMGQRLIFVLGQMLVLGLSLLPAGLIFFLVDLLLAGPFLGDPWALPVSACAAALVLAVEFGFGLAALGAWFEGYDLSAEQLT